VELTLEEITAAVGPLQVTGMGGTFAAVCTDTRKLKPGELFVALKGERFDGARFIPQALEMGAGGVVCRHGATDNSKFTKAGRALIIEVEDTLRALGDMARFVRNKYMPRVAAVTGSNGKTTVKEIVAAMCRARAPTAASRASFNNAVGLPLSLLAISGDERYVVVEMGMNSPGEIDYLAGIATPDVGLITNVGPSHIGPMGSLEAIARAKAEVWSHLRPDGTAVIAGSDPLVVRYAGDLRCRRITFGTEECHDVHPLAQEGEMLRASVTGKLICLPMPGPGPHAGANLLAALAVAAALGVDPETASRYEAFYTPPPGRLRVQEAPGGLTLIDDTYNANPASMRVALEVLKGLEGRRKLVVLGEMAELGDHAVHEHREIGKAAAFADFLFCSGEHASQYSYGAREGGMPASRVMTGGDAMDLAHPLQEAVREGDVVLVKGSRVARMERLATVLMRENQ